jgi:hypothetical protein
LIIFQPFIGESGVDYIMSDDILGMNEGSGGQYDIISENPIIAVKPSLTQFPQVGILEE